MKPEYINVNVKVPKDMWKDFKVCMANKGRTLSQGLITSVKGYMADDAVVTLRRQLLEQEQADMARLQEKAAI